jgi:hypothetical protein
VTARRTTAAALAVIALAAALVACGRRNPPRPTKDREAEYTYPRFYPAPATVLPAAGGEAGGTIESEPEPEEQIRSLSPIPSPDSRTRTYGPFSR